MLGARIGGEQASVRGWRPGPSSSYVASFLGARTRDPRSPIRPSPAAKHDVHRHAGAGDAQPVVGMIDAARQPRDGENPRAAHRPNCPVERDRGWRGPQRVDRGSGAGGESDAGSARAAGAADTVGLPRPEIGGECLRRAAGAWRGRISRRWVVSTGADWTTNSIAEGRIGGDGSSPKRGRRDLHDDDGSVEDGRLRYRPEGLNHDFVHRDRVRPADFEHLILLAAFVSIASPTSAAISSMKSGASRCFPFPICGTNGNSNTQLNQ